MKRFRFKFETVLKLRKQREEDALRALGNAQRAFQAEIERKQALLNTLEQALLRRETLADQGTTSIAFATQHDHITGTKQRIIQADQAILRARRGVEKALRVFLLARRATRTFEVLREKAFAEYKKARAKREQRELDDLSVMRARFTESFAS